MRTQLDLIFWNKLAGRCSYSESTKYACLMCKSDFCVRRSVFENDENVAVWKAAVQWPWHTARHVLRENGKINES